MKPSTNAVKYYEKHFPNSSRDVIGSGISYFKATGELNGEEIMQVFRMFYETEQYKTSIFQV